MATLLNVDWPHHYGLCPDNRHEFIAQLLQGRPQPSPIRPLLSFVVLRGVLRANPLGSDSPFDARIWLSDVGFVARFIAIVYPSASLLPTDYTQIAETICADYRPIALSSGISLIDGLISPHLHADARQWLTALADMLRRPIQLLGQTPSALFTDYERTLSALQLAPDALRRLQDAIQNIRACFEARKVERAQTIANQINSAPFLNALAMKWQSGERQIANHLHEAYSHTGQWHTTHGRRARFVVASSMAALALLIGAGQWLLSATAGLWQHAIAVAVQLLTALWVWFASTRMQHIRQQYGNLKAAKTIPGLHQLGFAPLLQRHFHPHAWQRLQQLRQLYRDYGIPYSQVRLDQLERWLKQGDMTAGD